MFGIRSRRAGAALALVAALVPVAACYDAAAPSGPEGPPIRAPRATIEIADADPNGRPVTVHRTTVPVHIRGAGSSLHTPAALDGGEPPSALIVPAVVATPLAAGVHEVRDADGRSATVRIDGVEAGRPPRVITLIQGDRSIRVEREWAPTDEGWVPRVQRMVAHEGGALVRTMEVTIDGLTPGVPPSPDTRLTGAGDPAGGVLAADEENCFYRAARLILDIFSIWAACNAVAVTANPFGGFVCYSAVLNALNDVVAFVENCVKDE
jgi:hypothetical protein